MKIFSCYRIGLFFLLSTTFYMNINAQNNMQDDLLQNLMKQKPSMFADVLSNEKGWNVQLLYTEIERGKKGKVKFTDHSFRLNNQEYFYPASTVKLPIAILALQKLKELNIKGLDKNTTMMTEVAGDRLTAVYNDPSSADGRPTIAHYIKKILLVSDNDAYNRLYEFLGQEYINNTLQKMGLTDVQIIHRLEISLTEEENRHTNPVKFIDAAGNLVYEKPVEKSKLNYAARNTKMGKGFYRGGQLINEPFDFSMKNRFTLSELHAVIKAVLFPEAVPAKMRFDITGEDHAFLQKYMSMMPAESASPVYDSIDHWDTYVKFLLYGSEKNTANKNIRIFNKVGDAYGFLIDGAHIVDYENKIEFLLSAVIYCNSDGIFNDDKYDYNKVGFPFLKNIGQLIYEYEKTKQRKSNPEFFPKPVNYSR